MINEYRNAIRDLIIDTPRPLGWGDVKVVEHHHLNLQLGMV